MYVLGSSFEKKDMQALKKLSPLKPTWKYSLNHI